jgi:hypothetical protein
VLDRYGLLGEVRDREAAHRWIADTESDRSPERVARIDLWREVRTTRARSAAVAWLRMLMTDREPVAAAAAAAGLSHWNAKEYVPVPASLTSARTSLEQLAGSTSPGARQIAHAALGVDSGPRPSPSASAEHETSSAPVSVMIHGTRAYAGTWWFVRGDFHSYVKRRVRPDLFSGRNAFSWSGKYDKKHREVAAERLAGWAEDTVGGSLKTVFAHSYGATIALNATAYGLSMSELVLLSAPVESVPVEWRHIGRAVSLRIHLDLVLLAARRKQYFAQNVDEHYINHWFWHHADSHDPVVWEDESCAQLLRL